MIYKALTFIANELNQYLKLRFTATKDKVVVANILNQDGSSTIIEDDRIIISLVNIEEEKHVHNNWAGGGSNPPVSLNLYVLFSTTFKGELSSDALKFISIIIGYFQSNKSFSSSDGLDSNVEKLSFEIFNLDISELSSLWAGLGAKYTPSILYKVRMIVIEEGMIDTDITPASSFSDE